jgi:HNH endonuclease/Group II intron, maturase-specific domain
MREELHQFLKTILHLELSMEKTRLTHLNDGFTFLGFHIRRSPRANGGMVTKITIPDEAIAKVTTKLTTAFAPNTHQDALRTQILAVKAIIRGWCQYYQYTSRASSQFNRLNPIPCWLMAHWLGRKFQLKLPMVMQRFLREKKFFSGEALMLQPSDYHTGRFRWRFPKPNPYLTQEGSLMRENLPPETFWSGFEPRPGMADLRPLILERDEYTCQRCGARVTRQTAEIDHIRPVRRFKRPGDATVPENLQTVCKSPCHQSKTEYDRRGESRVR